MRLLSAAAISVLLFLAIETLLNWNKTYLERLFYGESLAFVFKQRSCGFGGSFNTTIKKTLDGYQLTFYEYDLQASKIMTPTEIEAWKSFEKKIWNKEHLIINRKDSILGVYQSTTQYFGDLYFRGRVLKFADISGSWNGIYVLKKNTGIEELRLKALEEFRGNR